MNKVFERIKKANFQRPYIFFFILFFILYFVIDVFVNEIFVVGLNFFHYNLLIIIALLILNIIVASLFAITINLMIYRYKESKNLRKEYGIAPVGMLAGLMGGLCPGCFAGLFPAFLALFGVTLTLTTLPLFGGELLIIAIIIFSISIYLLGKEQSVCKVKNKK